MSEWLAETLWIDTKVGQVGQVGQLTSQAELLRRTRQPHLLQADRR